MPLHRIKFIALLTLFALPLSLFAALPILPLPTQIIPAPPSLAAKSYILMDAASNVIITAHEADQRVEPASLTKMMTVYVVDHAIQNAKLTLQDQVQISAKAWKAPGSRMFLEVNTTVSVEDLLRGIIIQSGNDASIAIAEHTAGSESAFAELMNFYAKQLGMKNTHFVNATGLPDPNHYSSARDMAILGKALIEHFPNTYALYSQKEFIYKEIKQPNRNRLLWRNEWIDGIKTGHTDSAGFCLVASGKQEDMRLIAVVMGEKNDNARIEESQTLLAYGFRFFETRKFYTASTVLQKNRIWMGSENTVNLGLVNDVYVTVNRGQHEKLTTAMVIDNVIKAPVKAGDPCGTISLQAENKTILEFPIVALQDISPGGFWSRLYDRVLLTAYALLGKLSA